MVGEFRGVFPSEGSLMPFDEYWKRLLKKNPALADGENRLTLSVKELKRIIESSYKEGQGHAEGIHRLIGDIFRKAGRG